ncbi:MULTISPECIES: TlpA disulfide reductase family protein [unclassified Oceanispirochaeta]|uniref:TlpA disulfide reductase family protein n=1 Tax=unclassified Oceanispirochaeta TaxID=2635722 RepID=UPI000E091BCA|nr:MULTISPECIES: TlpA disulfide reductase family protein [unclassified Oceanispirochaeta]MBF9015893.1 TlpA family protein disulfide reductase [Oceanispirochaeta sp. M2]NPD72356.1 TlpA family protein disulfide reductase [Oceanispirochaeta sp. M1]RDG32127.1 TlpA family protein disulfide reductase [Oceanispirochaeta sp. M1]
MINTSFTLGVFTIPIKLIVFIFAAAAAHLLLFILKREDRDIFKKTSDLFFNSVILFFLGWRLSLILTNWSTFRGAPTALLYLPGGFLNHLAGAAVVLLTVLIFYKRQKYSLKELARWSILTAGTLALYFILTVFLLFIPKESQFPDNDISLVENKPAAALNSDSEIILLTMEGEEQLLDLTGSPVTIVNFWASWCPPCRAEIPEIDRFYSDYKDSDIRLITVNMTSTEKSMQNAVDFIEEKKADFPVLLDHKGEAAAYFKINSVPSTFVFNSSGELTAQKTGAVDYAWLKNVSN